MRIGVVRVALCAMLLSFALSAVAFVDTPVIDQANPRAGDLITLSIRAGECDYLHGVPNPLSVTTKGGTIHVLLDSSRHSPPFCVYPIVTFPYNIGRFPAGEYVLQIDHTYSSIIGPQVQPIAMLPLSIAGGIEPAPIPVLSLSSVILLAGGLVFLASLYRRRREST